MKVEALLWRISIHTHDKELVEIGISINSYLNQFKVAPKLEVYLISKTHNRPRIFRLTVVNQSGQQGLKVPRMLNK